MKGFASGLLAGFALGALAGIGIVVVGFVVLITSQAAFQAFFPVIY